MAEGGELTVLIATALISRVTRRLQFSKGQKFAGNFSGYFPARSEQEPFISTCDFDRGEPWTGDSVFVSSSF